MWMASKTVTFLCPVPSPFIPFGSNWWPGQVTFYLNLSHRVWTSVGSSVWGLCHTQNDGLECVDAKVLEGKSLKYFQKNWYLKPSCLWWFILNWVTTKYRHCKACWPLTLSIERNHFEQSQLKILLNDRYVQWITIIIHGYHLPGFALGL